MNGHIQTLWNRESGFRQPEWRFKGWVLQLAAAGVFFVFLSAIAHAHIQPQTVPLRDRLVNLNLEDADFMQALDAISEQLNIKINFRGQRPSGERSLVLSGVPLGVAITRVVRLYGVQSHAAAYSTESMTTTLAILRTSSVADLSRHRLRTGISFEDSDPLTPVQMEYLAHQNSFVLAGMEEAMQPLAHHQMEYLREIGTVRDEDEGASLTSGQKEALQDQSLLIEKDMEYTSQPLTPQEIQQLEYPGYRGIHEEGQEQRPLTNDQLRMLEDMHQAY